MKNNLKNVVLTSLMVLASGCSNGIISSSALSSSVTSESTSSSIKEELSSSSLSTSSEESLSSSVEFSSSTTESSPISSSISESSSSVEESSSIITSTVKQEKVTSYANPLYRAEEVADPSIIYSPEDNYYYIIATGGVILRSRDMVNWTRRQRAFTYTPSWGTNGAGLWAPDVQYIDGQYVMYYSLSTWGDPNPGIGVAIASNPKGPWIDQGKLFTSQEIGVNNSIDPMAYVDHDGRVYLVWGSMRGNYIVELEKDGLSLKGGIDYARENKIRVAGLDTSYQWEVETYEGAFIVYENGYYYLFLSMGTCCEGVKSTYKVVVGRSRNITGPYLDHNLVDMKNKSAGKVVLGKGDYFVGSGHNSVIKDYKGNYYTYYHTYSLDDMNYRVLAMDALHFDEDGWPYVKDFKASQGEQEGPTTFEYINV